MADVLETHITVSCPPGGIPRLAAWAAARGLGFTHIELARGLARSQPMVNVRGDATVAVRDLVADGFAVVRVKTEAAPWAASVPQRDDDPREAGQYFEHHVKLLLPADHERPALERLATPHGAHLSWNARRVRPDGRQERFVTQRCHDAGRDTAERRLTALLDALRAAGHHILEVEREFVLHDSNLALDDGWIAR
ncbi:hypothetical protein [Streptomyces hainanensis]|uniref:Ankyrin n=1 Tax=Streptomyces hainanensis TaxID=402648 RepID=A0A4R4TQD7_9ACTN|nr:hypothetical protein [Streptomyces hainanensis]TDC80407.1 hypothetical protein E1283_00255 [Streptomyces hainanensis]